MRVGSVLAVGKTFNGHNGLLFFLKDVIIPRGFSVESNSATCAHVCTVHRIVPSNGPKLIPTEI